MSEDIVARLDSSYAFFGDPLDIEARDEIVLLRAEIQELKKDSTIFIIERGNAISQNADLREENDRLRAALEKIMQKCSYARRDKWCACIDCKCIIARAALGEEKTDAQNHVP